MLPRYKATQAFDAQLVYETWLTLVAEEPLYDAMREGRHAEVARRLGLSETQVLILDDFRAQEGTRWHIENLRFRCTTMVGRILKWHLPGTIELLTRGANDWLRDLAYEYMAHSHWQDFGHHNRGPECHRFAQFVRQRIMRRRRPPEHLDAVLRYELQVLDLVQAAGKLPLSDWPTRPPPEQPETPLNGLRLRASPVAQIAQLPVDIVRWLSKPEGELRIDAPNPVHVLIWIPSCTELPQSALLDDAARQLFTACDGSRTAEEISVDSTAHTAQLQRWLAQGVLVAAPPPSGDAR